MGRKLRLVARKNGERKRCAKMTPALTISITKALIPVPDINSLSSHLCKMLPSTWSLSNGLKEEREKIILYSLETSGPNPILRYSITIQECFSWNMSAFGFTVSPQLCRVLSTTPDKLDNVHMVKQFISVIDCCKVCEGNSDETFMEVAKRRDDIFKDQSGKISYDVLDLYF